TPQLLRHDALGLLLAGFMAVCSIVAGTRPLHRSRQKLLAQFVTAQKPAPPNQAVMSSLLRRPAALGQSSLAFPFFCCHPFPSLFLSSPAAQPPIWPLNSQIWILKGGGDESFRRQRTLPVHQWG